MESVANLPPAARRDLFFEAAARRGMAPSIVEKDFWVCWALGRLFAHPELARLLMFKGGTSLSKVFHLIERFSEDIDLILDWRVVAGDDDPMAARSKAKQNALNDAIERRANAYITGELSALVAGVFAPVCSCEQATDDFHAINVHYPAAFADDYLRPQVRLEIGPLAAWQPYDTYQVHPYAADEFPGVFTQPEAAVRAIRAERTFWEKATILHQEANRPASSPVPLRYSRHYYDLAAMAGTPVKTAALADMDLLEDVTAFKQRFYPRAWAQYELARPGTFKLAPGGHLLDGLRKDYASMRNMIYGRYPSFDEVLQTLNVLEGEINAAPARRAP